MHVFSAPIAGEDGALIDAVVVQLVRGRSLGRTLELLYNDHRELRLRADVIVLRTVVEEQFEDDAASSGARIHLRSTLAEARDHPEKTFSRANDKPVRLLGSREFRLMLSANINPLVGVDPLAEYGISDQDAIASIREAEMRHIAGLARAVLPQAPGRAYQAPSGSLVRSFLRVGNIQFSRASLDALFFWLLPHLSRCGGIVTDTWSISSLALNAARLLSLYGGGAHIPVEVLSEYQDRNPVREAAAVEVLQHLLAEMAEQASRERPTILCIISATQTGSLAGRLTEILNLYGAEADVEFVALYKMRSSDIAGLSDWTTSLAFQPLSAEDRAAADPVIIDPQLYFPLTFHDIEYEIRDAHAAGGKRFLADYGGNGFLSVHRDHADDGGVRHHGIHLDTVRLVQHPTFLERWGAKIAGLDPAPALVISPLHDAGQALAVEAGRVLAQMGQECAVFHHSSLFFDEDGLPEESRQLRDTLDALPDTAAILIVDDMFMTGTRLRVYERELRKRTFRGRVHYLVGVARPVGAEAWQERCVMRCYRPRAERKHFERNTMDAVERFFLPSWEEAHCPWCQEQHLYSSLMAEGLQLPPVLQERSRRLQGARTLGMRDDLFLVAPPRPPFEITRDSLFAEPGTSQADVFASVAAAVQVLRCSPPAGRPPLGRRRFPVSTVLKGREYLHEMYTDSILRAAIIRAAEPDELAYADNEKEEERTDWVRHLITSLLPDEWELVPELLLSAALDKCSIASPPEVAESLEAHGFDSMAAVLLPRAPGRNG
jgi:hypothetical protein